MTFADRMRDLEERFASAAAADGDVYLPNFTPRGPVDAVLVCMEPSLGRWARTPAEAASKIDAGFRNFMWSLEDFVLHYAASAFLCDPGQTYHVTDVSKGAMTVDHANVDRDARYARWSALLDEEIRLVAKPLAPIIAVGQAVRNLLSGREFGNRVTAVMHYSGQANAARNAAVVGREAEFEAFAERISISDVMVVAENLLRANDVPSAMKEETLARVRNGALTTSRKKLAFIYATTFTELRRQTAPQRC